MSTLTDAIAPILSDLSTARTDYLEFKAELAAAISKIAAHQIEVDKARASFESAKREAISQDFFLYTTRDYLRRQVEHMGTLHTDKRRAEWIFKSAESYYIGIENALKAKILEAGGTVSMFPTYVPARPGVMSEAQPTPCRQLAIDAAAMKEIDGFNTGNFDANRLPVV